MDSWKRTAGWPLFAVLATAAAAADLATKWSAFSRLGMPGQQPPHELVPGWLALETSLNEGALFGMGQGMGVAFATVSVAAIAGILALVARPATREDPWVTTALALIVGGVAGNLFDRLGLAGLSWEPPAGRAGQPVLAVRDWIHVTVPGLLDWPIFNFADCWLVIGATMLLISSFSGGSAAADRSPP